MSLLPSPVPHPLDYSPWDLPGWIHEALDWVVGVEWPDGNERAVWDLADQWYAVAAALAGPRADAVAAAAEVRGGYGGAVGEAFDAAWRRVAEGEEAPLPVLLAVSTDLGRLVEECGCDIEAAKLEVWIELGILVVELLSLAVATVLTAGAASPAAGAAITASRLIVQQIFRRLTAQLARASLRQGLKEAGERAAKQVAEGGVRGLARRAATGALTEAGEEAGVTLATQAYQTSTGRRDGPDLSDLGASALGGLAGGAAAPLAGLGRHASGPGARTAEHLGREAAGEVIAENAAALATGQGLTSVEDAARAAVSGGVGSATAQADAAIRSRLDVLAAPDLGASGGLTLPTVDGLAGPVAAAVPEAAPTAASGPGAASGAAVRAPAAGDAPALSPQQPSDATASTPPVSPPPAVPPVSSAAPLPPSVPPVSLPPSVSPAVSLPPSVSLAVSLPPSVSPAVPLPLADGASPTLSAAAPVAVPPSGGSVDTPATATGPTTTGAGMSTPAWSAAGPGPTAGVAAAGPAGHQVPVPVPGPPPPVGGADHRPPGGRQLPDGATGHGLPDSADRRPPDGASHRSAVGATIPAPPADVERARPRTPEWYAATWAADRDAFERRRYRGHFAHQRTNHEELRRHDRAAELRLAADRTQDEVRWLTGQGRLLAEAGRRADAERHFAEARDRERWCHQQRDLAEAILAGNVAPPVADVDESAFVRINDDVGDLATGAVETGDRSALTDDDHPPPIDRSRRYGRPGGLRPPLALHQTDVERRVPRDPDGRVVRTPDPRQGDWFRLVNDGGPAADPTRGINCADCTLSLFDTWMHGRPRVAAPRTFDAYAAGDVNRPLNGEQNGPGRVEDVTGGRFQRLCDGEGATDPGQRRHAVDRGYRNLHDQLLLGGHGSYAFVINTWEGGGSHLWVALNQNGTVLYLDPQTGRIGTRPLYRHSGVAHPYNVVDLDVLVLGPDARPMPMAGLRRGRFSVLPDLPEFPPASRDEGYGEPYLNRMHTLAPPGSAVRDFSARDDAEPVDARMTGMSDLDDALRAGVPPAELAAALNAATLRQLVPQLDDAAARDLATFFADHRVRDMLDRARREPPRTEPLLAEKLIRQLVQQPDVVRMALATPELLRSLTARPLTLYHLTGHQQAIDVLGEVLDEISEPGPKASATNVIGSVEPTPLSDEQRLLVESIPVSDHRAVQPGFDASRADDEDYRRAYLDWLYVNAVDAQSEVLALAERLALRATSGAVAATRPSPKDRQRAEDKIDKYDGDVSLLTDLAAAKVVFNTLPDLYDALLEIRVDERVQVVELDDRFVSPQASGYRDIQMSVRTSNGHIAEFRLHLRAIDEVAEWEHVLYEVRRDLKAVAKEQGRSMSLNEQAIFNGVLVREQAHFWRALQAALTGVREHE
ncbi:toxin glutamine deamidase domain-containing protein [Micromonospora costi]|uniref:toxin glutamine deamidase domain-containing protein n=1 Tax=Micromonospora costi TaxID=1530042 RepID=UPI0033F224DD